MTERAGNFSPEQRDELARRVSSLYVASRIDGGRGASGGSQWSGQRVCPLCGGTFPEQGQWSLSSHLAAAHAAAILAMPDREDFRKAREVAQVRTSEVQA